MMESPTFVLFSGHNDRAVVALCRFFKKTKLSWAIIASSSKDAIHRTHYRSRVIFSRTDCTVSLSLFNSIAEAIKGPIVFCPTTEFINQFLIKNISDIQAIRSNLSLNLGGIDVGLPNPEIYMKLTGKFSSRLIVRKLIGIEQPPLIPWPPTSAPCVLKPHENIVDGTALYPKICFTKKDLDQAIQKLDPRVTQDQWFAQKYITGKSFYLCGYLSRDGERCWYWQENLMQQFGGKSIVLARATEPIGLDADRFFDGLSALGYYGPLMMEVILDAANKFHYIEINPRFWGPLQLSLCCCPQMLELFAKDYGALKSISYEERPSPQSFWYAWEFGAAKTKCFRYPTLAGVENYKVKSLLKQYDVYNSEDTSLLHGCY